MVFPFLTCVYDILSSVLGFFLFDCFWVNIKQCTSNMRYCKILKVSLVELWIDIYI